MALLTLGFTAAAAVAFWCCLILLAPQNCQAIHCFIGNATTAKEAKVIDCSSLGMQREELYCRNVTAADGSVSRNCVAMSWFDATWEELGCHDNGGLTRCTCGSDFCNAPFSPAEYSANDAAATYGFDNFLSFLLLFMTASMTMMATTKRT